MCGGGSGLAFGTFVFEAVDVGAAAGDDEGVAFVEGEGWGGFEGFGFLVGVWGWAFDEDDGDFVLGGEAEVGEFLVVEFGSDLDLGELVFATDGDAVGEGAGAEHFGEAVSHVAGGEDDEVGAEAFEDVGVFGVEGAGDEFFDFEFLEGEGGEDVALHVVADGDDDGVGVEDVGGAEVVGVFGVQFDGVESVFGEVFDAFGVDVGDDDFAAEL